MGSEFTTAMEMTRAPGGLRLPSSLGVGASVQREVHEQWTTLPSIQEELGGHGFTPLPAPTFAYPGTVSPEQLTNQNNTLYSTLYAEHLAWYNYTAEIVALIRATLVELENEMDDIASRIRRDEREKNKRQTVRDNRLSGDDIRDLILQEPRYRSLLQDKQRYDQKKLLMEAKLDAMDRNLRVLSRQVEIRKTELERTQTGSNMPGRGGSYGLRT